MATILIKLYNYHDDDLLQLRLNGLDLGFIFARALEACFHQEKIRFVFPQRLVLDKTRRKNCRIRITLNDKTQNDLCTWLEGFEPYYRNQAIKNIARMYLDGNGISCFNAFYQSGKWSPASTEGVKDVMVPYLRKKKQSEDPEEWLDRISKGQTKRGMTGKKKQDAIQKLRETPLNELLNKPNHAEPDTALYNDTDSFNSDPANEMPEEKVETQEQKTTHGVPDYDIMQTEDMDIEPDQPAASETPIEEETVKEAEQPVLQKEYTESVGFPGAVESNPATNFSPDIPATTDTEPESNENDDADDSYDVFQMFESLRGN